MSIPPTPDINQWSKVLPVTLIGKKRCYFEIPAFSLTDLTYTGASIIVAVFNYAATKNIVLRNLPTKPDDPDYVPCIKYRMEDGTVYRYKLWEVDGDGIYYPVYNGEIILTNFQIEIWGLTDFDTATNDEAIVINNSILIARDTNFNPAESDTEEEPEDGDIVTDLQNTNAVYDSLPTNNAVFRWSSEGESPTTTSAGKLVDWTDLLNTYVFSQGVAGLRPTFDASVEALGGGNRYSASFDGVDDTMDSTIISAENLVHLFIVCKVKSTVDGAAILSGTNREYLVLSNVTMDDFEITSSSGNNGVNLVVANGEYTEWMILELYLDTDTFVKYTNLKDDTTDSFKTENGENLQEIGVLTLGTAGIEIAELLGYNTFQDGSNYISIIGYLKSKYGGMTLPLTFTTDQHGIAN